MKQYITGLKINHAAAVEVSEDFELPDYRAEVRRAAGVQCTVTRDNAFLEGNTVEVSGCVLYTVVYLGGEGELTSAPFYSTWSAKIPLPEEGGIGTEDLHLTADSENVVCRVTGPRKLTLSARVRIRCTALGETDCTAAGMDGGDTICRIEETPVLHMKTCRHTGSVSGEAAGGGVIVCRGSVQITETRRTPEGIAVAGEAVVRMLTLGENGAYTPIRSRVPISDTIPCPRTGLPEAAPGREEVTVSGKCAALTITEGDNGMISWEMEYDLDGTLLACGTASRAADGYSTVCEDTPVFRQTEAVTNGSPLRGQITLTGEKPLRRDDAGDLQFLYGWGRGMFEKGEMLAGSRMLLTGTAHCTVLLTGNGDIVTEEAALPIRYEYDLNQSGNMPGSPMPDGETIVPDCRCSFTVWDVGGHMEGSILHLHAEAGCDGILLYRQECKWLHSLTCHADRPLPKSRPAVILYTPDPGETAWDVQKRYRTTNVTEADGRYVIRK